MNAQQKTKRAATVAVISAMAFLAAAFLRIPVISFLKFDPKDVIITICGFIYGPAAACITALISCLLEFATVSSTGVTGLVMNIISSIAFAGTASYIYSRKKTMRTAVISLLAAIAVMSCAMLLWNYLISPLYMNVSRQQIAPMLITMFLPFNLIKGTLNAAITMLIYKPVVSALRRARLAPEPKSPAGGRAKGSLLAAVLAASAAAGLIVLILHLNGTI